MKNLGRIVMILGVAIAFINYISYIGRTETIMQQLFQVAETMMIMTGFYIFGRGISFSFNKPGSTIDESRSIKRNTPLMANSIKTETKNHILWVCPHCKTENTRNESICEKCNIKK